MKNRYLMLIASSFLVSSISVNATTLDEVTVTTATKTKKSIEGVTATVIVITKEEIEKMGAQSLKDVLGNTSGLNIQYGTFPSASSKSKSSISIRGMSANGTLFLLDGRRLATEVKNPYDLDRIPASFIEKIEVVKGPMSTLYGADAVGGVINIITKKPTLKPEIDIDLRYGQNQDGEAKNKNASFSIRGTKAKLKYSIFANKTKTTPYTQEHKSNVMVKQVGGPNSNTKQKPSNLSPFTPSFALRTLQDTYFHDVTYREKSDINSFGARFDYAITDKTNLGFDLNAFEEDREGSYIGFFHPSNYKTPKGTKIPVFNIPVYSKDDNKRVDLGVDFETLLLEDLSLKLRAYKSDYKKRNTTTAKYFKQMGFLSQSQSASNGLNANVDIKTYEAMLNYALNDFHYFTTGLEYRDEKREATVFDNTPNMSERSVDYKAIYLQDQWQITDSLSAVLGTRYDKVSNAEDKNTFKIGLVNQFSSMLNVRGVFAQGYRTPDIREMYINKQTPNGLQQGADIVGYDLKPEFTNTYEIGLSGRDEKFSYDIALFFNDIENKIEQVQKTSPQGSYYTFENISEAQTKGLELNLNYKILKNLSTSFNFTQLKTEDKNTNTALDFNPNRTLFISLAYEPSSSLSISPLIKYIGEQKYTQNKKQMSINSYTLVDLNLDYKINKKFSIYAGVNNIFDEKVDDILGSNVGVYYFTGLRFSF